MREVVLATLRIDRRPRLPIPPTLATVVAQLFWVIAIGLILTYAFFVVLGALDPAQASGMTAAVLLLLALWGIRVWSQAHRHDEGRDQRLMHARERRGF